MILVCILEKYWNSPRKLFYFVLSLHSCQRSLDLSIQWPWGTRRSAAYIIFSNAWCCCFENNPNMLYFRIYLFVNITPYLVVSNNITIYIIDKIIDTNTFFRMRPELWSDNIKNYSGKLIFRCAPLCDVNCKRIYPNLKHIRWILVNFANTIIPTGKSLK